MKVLAAVDFGDSSLEALRQARSLAHGVGGTLAACHVLPALPDLSMLLPERISDPDPVLGPEQAEIKQHLAAHAREKLGLELSEIFIDRGSAYAEVVRRAETWGADYVVVGTHGRTGLLRVALGSVAELVVRHAHCSVLVARPTPKSNVVLAATDLSDPSLPAITAGAEAARRSGARLVVASALDWALASPAAGLIGAMPAMAPPEVHKQAREALQTALEGAVAAARLSESGIATECRVLDGSPASAIVNAAEELSAELVVVGTHGRTGLARLALGSVAERVVQSAGTSVLTVRHRSRA